MIVARAADRPAGSARHQRLEAFIDVKRDAEATRDFDRRVSSHVYSNVRVVYRKRIRLLPRFRSKRRASIVTCRPA